jgi:tRNA (cmo5U34)-methyltransferase
MSVAQHLGIELADYDARIRTFIPDYEEMLDVAAVEVPPAARTIVDLGVGTGALASRCLEAAPRAHLFGIDLDPDILAMASTRLGRRATFAAGSFLRTELPRCDAAVSSFALHHVRTRPAKAALYDRIHAALRPGGLLLSVDCQPATDPAIRRKQLAAWIGHLRQAYTPARAAALLDAWSGEDVYVPLDAEVDLLRRSGFRVEVLWRRGAFAVLRAAR